MKFYKIGQGFPLALLLLCTFFISIQSISATTITWNGSFGNWNTASNWSGGTLPTAADHVVIDGGRVTVPSGFTAEAQSVEVISGDLWVRSNASLLIADATTRPGLEMNGRMRLDGYLEILNMNYTTYSSGAGTAIKSDGSFNISSSGELFVDDTKYHAIFLDYDSRFTNSGQMTLTNMDRSAIFNRNYFSNSGTISVDIATTGNISALVNYGEFNNRTSGVLDFDGGGSYAVLNSSAGTFYNWGELEIDDTGGNGIRNSGAIYNYEGAEIDIFDTNNSCIYNRTSGSFYNYGSTVAIFGGSQAILNSGAIFNYDLMNMIGNTGSSSRAYRDYASAVFDNYGSCYLQGLGTTALYLSGSFENKNEGYVFLYKKAYVTNTGVLTNRGFFTSVYESGHWRAGSGVIINYGAMNDRYDSFGFYVDNQELLSKPLANVLQNGVAYPNALEVNALSNFSVGAWKTAPAGGVVAGSYNAATNEFTPNTNAIGLSALYVEVVNNVAGNSQIATIYLDDPIAAMISQQEEPELEALHFRTSFSQSYDVKVFPNPTAGLVELSQTEAMSGTKLLYIYNNLGQLVFQKEIAELATPAFSFPQHLPNGQYQMRLMQSGKQLTTKSILLVRE